ncbi:MAG TPA: zinc ribbon domain-containing protein, partial [bacterium]
CGHPIAPRAQFCENCGTQVVEGIVCAVCHEANRGDSRYCAVCGSALKIPATASAPRPGSRD